MFFSKPSWAPVLVAIAAVPMAGTLLLDSVELSSAAPSENCSPADCNDRNPCTDDELVFCACRFQICAPVCEHTAISGKRCHDDNPCTTDDACFSGACVGVPSTGGHCDDANACTASDTCSNGICVGAAVTCDDGDSCTSDTCDPTTGACSSEAISCNDGNECTADFCDPAAGGCFYMGQPGETTFLRFTDAVTLEWDPAPDAVIHNSYRGTVPELGGMGDRGSFPYDHVCLESGNEQMNGLALSVDDSPIPPGAVRYYLTNGELVAFCEGMLGTASDDTLRPNPSPCPTPPP